MFMFILCYFFPNVAFFTTSKLQALKLPFTVRQEILMQTKFNAFQTHVCNIGPY